MYSSNVAKKDGLRALKGQALSADSQLGNGLPEKLFKSTASTIKDVRCPSGMIFYLLCSTLVLSLPAGPDLTTERFSDQGFVTSENTIRNTACIRAGNQGQACHDGGDFPDPGAQGGKTACGTDALATGIVGIDFNHFGKQTGGFSPLNLCGRKVKITNLANGKTVTGVIMDRISQNRGNQVDMSREMNIAIGGDGTHNLKSQVKVDILPVGASGDTQQNSPQQQGPTPTSTPSKPTTTTKAMPSQQPTPSQTTSKPAPSQTTSKPAPSQTSSSPAISTGNPGQNNQQQGPGTNTSPEQNNQQQGPATNTSPEQNNQQQVPVQGPAQGQTVHLPNVEVDCEEYED